MIRYISKLKEEFDIPYIANSEFNLKAFYNAYRHRPIIYQMAGNSAVEIGDQDIVDKMIEKGAQLDVLLFHTVKTGNLKLVKHLVERGSAISPLVMWLAASIEDKEILNYLTA